MYTWCPEVWVVGHLPIPGKGKNLVSMFCIIPTRHRTDRPTFNPASYYLEVILPKRWTICCLKQIVRVDRFAWETWCSQDNWYRYNTGDQSQISGSGNVTSLTTSLLQWAVDMEHHLTSLQRFANAAKRHSKTFYYNLLTTNFFIYIFHVMHMVALSVTEERPLCFTKLFFQTHFLRRLCTDLLGTQRRFTCRQ